MNIQSIKYLVALSKYSHFGKAAKACFVSQPTLSMQVRKLEDRLGVQLLERSNKSVKLTEVGELIAGHAATILREIDTIREHAQAAKDPYSGQIKVGIIPTVAPYLLPLILPQLTQAFPKLTFCWQEAQTTTLLDELKQGKLDTAILALPITENYLTTDEFFKEEFFLAVPQKHIWSKRKTIQNADLNGENLLLLNDGHCLREQALAVCQQIQASEAEDFRATSLETLRHMVAAGIGITLIPKLARRKDDGISYLSISDSKPFRKLGIAWRKSTGRALLFNDISKHLKIFLQRV